MNNIARRIIAGVSAAALFVSAVGSDAFMGIFGWEIYAVSADDRGKIGKSTGFPNLEQDTYGDYYNTGYGLHTNKTATAVGADGRTFDVNLESWYVGENPVDVATILDASGSMAWTVDTLEPLKIYDKAVNASADELMKKYAITEADLKKYDEDTRYENANKETKVLAAIQDKNGGYLPQDVVDLILDKTKTDNSKLSYSDYLYYIYESRSSVSEFVPLGYWDGGEPSGALKPIGYYKFDGSLKNEITGEFAKYIVQDSSGFYPGTEVTSVPVEFADGGLDLYETDKKGNVVINLSSLEGKDFEISFKISAADKHATCYNTPLVYVGNSTKTDYYALYRGDSASATSTRNAKKFRIVNEKNKGGATAEFSYYTWIDCTMKFIYDSASSQYTISCKTGSTDMPANDNDELKINDKDFYLILGGNELLQYSGSDPGTDISKNKIKDLKITVSSETVANFPLESNLKNSKGGDIKAELMENAADGSSAFNVTEYDIVPATPIEAKYKNGGLDLNETAKNGAIMLDVVPNVNSEDGFTISMKIMKSSGSLDKGKENNQRNIFYLGNKDIIKNDYYQFFRSAKTGGCLVLSHNSQKDETRDEDLHYVGGLPDTEWHTNTLVFKPIDGGYKVTPYVDGKPAENREGNLQFPNGTGKWGDSNEPESIPSFVSTEDLVFLLGALQNNAGDEGMHFIKNLYIFDEALEPDEVALVAQDKLMKDPAAETDGCGGYHATTKDDKDIAQITSSLKANPDDDQREGWYYVNSHSVWADISGCLAGGKQYLGIVNDIGLGVYEDGIDPSKLVPGGSGGTATEPATGYEDDNQSIATIPSVYQSAYDEYMASSSSGRKPEEVLGAERAKYYEYYRKLKDGNDSTKTFTPSANERSLQFYIDSQGYLRCFFCTGDFSWKKSGEKWSYSPRTFCSVVYVKEKYDVDKRLTDGTDYGNPTKYEELNFALNQFYQNLANSSDLSNTAIVRFSTHNLIQGNSEDAVNKNAVDHLKMLIMEDWTNYSDVYSNSNGKTDKKDYLQNLLIPANDDETSTSTEKSSARSIDEYPYVMTGGTYTWTGLKAFYDNMVKTKKDYEDDPFDNLSSGDTVYNIANDARDKYLIIFTDGRDNTIGSTDTKYVKEFTTDKSKKVTSYGNFAPYYDDGKQQTLSTDADLAKAWADKIKDEGYTIFCVMLATGSISQTTNKDEYDKAYQFLETLAGDKDGKRTAEDCISVVGEGNSTLEKAFADILSKIQQPRQDYTVQDYIDPRFDLIDKDDNVYHLGAGGKITVTDKDGNVVTTGLTLSDGKPFTNGSAVGNIIDNIDKTGIAGLAYTPRDSYMVNRKADSTSPDGYTTGDGVGTGYLYYDDEKDMYYLRWTDQIIPMENESFDTSPTTDPPNKKLDVWSATIRLKAKDDFIGGNYILTNGNEAGENLVYSDATIENMDKGDNYKLYGFEEKDKEGGDKIPYRKKLEALSGTNRKINAVDAGGVSQAVYGDGIDIPSSGFPRVTVNVRLLPLNAYDLSDVIYMGEVVSPTMMLADLENDYMTGSYYLQYLERYAYRVYGGTADAMPLIELLNKWLKIDDEKQASKTFTIPYIYLPDPQYKNGELAKDTEGNVIIENSTGWDSDLRESTDFADLNLRDVTGFITYTWKRDDDSLEEQQKMEELDAEGKPQYDITKDYVVKNTEQIKYNLQLKFTPLKYTAKELEKFTFDTNFIKPDSTGEGGDKFFNIDDTTLEFAESVTKWSTEDARSDYLKAMVKEEKTYEPHVMYDEKNEKWVLVDEKSEDGFTPTGAVEAYTKTDPSQITKVDDKTVTDKGVYDWDTDYKPVAGNEQLETDRSYTNTSDNVSVTTDNFSLIANTTYTKDVVNAALALELFVDGKYLNKGSEINPTDHDKIFTFIATRYYDDPYDPLPFDKTETINADTGETGKKYQLTFTVDKTSLPDDPQENVIYKVWAYLSEVKVENTSGSDYEKITNTVEDSSNPYCGYAKADALPIGTYVIDTVTNPLDDSKFTIGTDILGKDVNFAYLKTDSTSTNYTHDKFPDSVSSVSETAAESTGDGDYQIWNEKTDNSKKNIAENDRTKDTTEKTQTVTFYFGTVDGDDIGKKGESTKDHLTELVEGKYSNEYTKDRLGIILLSVDPNSLAISKEVTNTSNPAHENKFWQFTVTFTPNTGDNADEFKAKNATGFDLQWYKGDDSKLNTEMGTDYPKGGSYPSTINFTDDDNDGTYTATIYLKHNEKVVIKGLQEGTWQVVETDEREKTFDGSDGIFYSAHNNMDDFDEHTWSNETNKLQLQPASYVDYVNEFPYDLPSAGGIGTNILIYSGITFMLLSGLSFAILYKRGRSRDKPKG